MLYVEPELTIIDLKDAVVITLVSNPEAGTGTGWGEGGSGNDFGL